MSLVDMRDGVLTRTIGELTGSSNKAGAFVRRHVIPTDPKSNLQVNRRLRMKELGVIVRQAFKKGVQDTIYPDLEKTTYWAFCMSHSKVFLSALSSNPNLLTLVWGTLRARVPTKFEIKESTGLIEVRWLSTKEGEIDAGTKVRAFFWNEDRSDSIYSGQFPIGVHTMFVAHPWAAGEAVFMEFWLYNIGEKTSPPAKQGTVIFP